MEATGGRHNIFVFTDPRPRHSIIWKYKVRHEEGAQHLRLHGRRGTNDRQRERFGKDMRDHVRRGWQFGKALRDRDWVK